MKRTMMLVGALVVVLVLVLQASASFGSPGQAKKHSGPITIESWLLASPSETALSGTVKACFKLKGSFYDQGGDPTWSDSTYAVVTSSLAHKCGDWQPVGGFVLVPPVSGTLSTLYAVHTLTGQKGDIFITFSGTYDLVTTFQGSGTWVITGGSGAYTGVKAEGTWTADASGFPYIRHTETGLITTG